MGRQFGCIGRILLIVIFLNIYSETLISQQIKILALGNSITWGTNISPDNNAGIHPSFRYKLYQLLNQNGYNFDFIGTRSSGYNFFNDAQHCGLPGVSSTHIASIFQTGYNPHFAYLNYESPGPYLNYYPADIVLLDVGTNDILEGDIYDLSEYSSILNAVNSYETVSGKPVLVLVAKAISSYNSGGSCNADWEVNTFNSNLQTLVNDRITNGDKLVLVDLQCGAGLNYATDMLDTLHPNQAGYEKIGQTYFNVINSLNTAPVITNIPNPPPVNEGASFAQIFLDTYISDNEDADADIAWTTSPSTPQYFNITIVNRVATITPKDPEFNGSETITFIGTDRGKFIPGLKKSASDQVIFTVSPVNDPPVIVSQKTISPIPEDVFIDLSINDLNVNDPDTPPANRTMYVLTGSNYTFTGNRVTPSLNYNGNLNINVIVSDGLAFSDTFPIVILVQPVNDPPILTLPANRTINERSPYTGQMSITDFDMGNSLSITPQVLPSWLTYNPVTKTLNGTPYFANIGNNTVVMRGSDGIVTFDSTFIIKVKKVNHKPVITSVPILLADDYELYSYTITAYDPDNDNITFSILNKPEWSSFNALTGKLTGTPNNSQVGNYTVRIKVSDIYEDTIQQYGLFVTNNNSKPYFISQPDTNLYAGEQFAYFIQYDDVDEDNSLVLSIVSPLPAWLQYLSSSKLLIGRPDVSYIGNYSVTIRVSDGIAYTDQLINITVQEPSGEITNKVNVNPFTIYPNPAENFITIFSEETGITGFKVFDLNGKILLLFENLPQEREFSIDPLTLVHGVYIYEIETINGIFQGKLFIK